MSFRPFFIFELILSFTLLTACEKDTSIKLHHSEQSLVVEGKIESGKPPKIILTKSVSFFSHLDTSMLNNLFVHDAEIIISTSNKEVSLIEKKIDTLPGFSLYYYEPENASELKGFPGQAYKLNIKAEGKSYEATTTIPAKGFVLDSIWWTPSNENKQPDSSKALLMAKIYDPPERGDYARYFTKRNQEPFYPGIISVAEDNITNGKQFNFQITRGIPKSREANLEEFGFFHRGDTVTLKFCNIDHATYRFWNTWEYAWSNNGNPFSTPGTVKGNIPDAIGYWGGYQVQYKTLIIPQ